MKNQKKVIGKLLDSVSENGKSTYSIKLDNDKIEILREFFKITKINAGEFFEEIIDFEELKEIINSKKVISEKEENTL